MKTNFFPRQAIAKFRFVLHSRYPWKTSYQDWFGFRTIPRPDEKDLFLKFVIREIRKFPYEKLIFFLGKL